MPTPEQRLHRLERLAELRRTRKIVLADFLNDEPLAGGCMAGGHQLVHINAHGDVEPCVFAHFAVDNVRDKPLKEILLSDFFAAIRAHRACCVNPLRSCLVTDDPAALRDIVDSTGAQPTHGNATALFHELAPDLDAYAACYAPLADAAWSRGAAIRP